MSFNIRYFNWDRIKEIANKEDFDYFDQYIKSPNSCFIEDKPSFKFINKYIRKKKDSRKKMYKKIKTDKDGK